MEFNENFILGCSAIGAGLAVIAGIGPVRVSQLVMLLLQLAETRVQNPISPRPCCLVRRLPRQPVCMVC